MDGQAIALAFASQSGSGLYRLKVYQIIKKEIEAIEAIEAKTLVRLVVHVEIWFEHRPLLMSDFGPK